jgi:TPR repeat protein
MAAASLIMLALSATRSFGQPAPVSDAEVSRRLEEAAAAGDPMAQFRLAQSLWDGERRAQDRPRALLLYEAAARKGIASAQSFLGWAHLTGQGVTADAVEAYEWLSAAARQEDGYASFLLSQVYARGDGVEQDLEHAYDLLVRAAELAYAPARLQASALLLYGPMSRRDSAKGIYLLEQAARSEDSQAHYILGREYLAGLRTQRDVPAAAYWISRAAEADHVLGGLWLSELYAKGLGVDRDSVRADAERRAALERATGAEKNLFAWQLATRDNPIERNGAVAVAIMEDLLRTADNRTAAYLDTLAAAYAESGRFDEAVATQIAAAAALPADLPAESRAGFDERLALYRRNEAYREMP